MPIPVNSYVPINLFEEDLILLKEKNSYSQKEIDPRKIFSDNLENMTSYCILWGFFERKGRATLFASNKTIECIVNRTLDLHDELIGAEIVKNTEYGVDENFSTSGWSIIPPEKYRFFDGQREAQYLRLFTWLISTILSYFFLKLIFRKLKISSTKFLCCI